MLYNSFNELASGNAETPPISRFSVFNPDLPTDNALPPISSNPQQAAAAYAKQQAPPQNTGTTTSAPVPAVDPAFKAIMDEYIPEWGKSLGQRVGVLETDVKWIKENMVTKDEFTAQLATFEKKIVTEIKQAITGK